MAAGQNNCVERFIGLHPELTGKTGDLTTIIQGPGVPDAHMEIALKAPKFKNFVLEFNHAEISMTAITIRNVYPFGPNLGFAFLDCATKTRNGGKMLPGAVFLRGAAVAILVFARCNGMNYVLLTKQFRVPIGGFAIVEAVAGMMDEDKDPIGVAIKELQEESGIALKRDDLIHLCEITPSAGGCDEKIQCYATHAIEMSADKLAAIQEHVFGTGDETIRIVAEPFNTLEDATALIKYRDSKLNTCALAMIGRGLYVAQSD
jgi:8-oxo-dGTP pyrophosphatase MutT (NUDIX family)